MSHLFVSDLTAAVKDKNRMIDTGEVVASVLLAIVMAHELSLTHVGWAAFSGYMVMRAHVRDSLLRGALRVTGTICGALLAVHLPLINQNSVVGCLILGAVTCICLYCALTTRHSYAWLFMGLTFAMVSMDGIEHGASALHFFAYARIHEVALGTSCSVFVSAISTLFIRRYFLPDSTVSQASITPAVPFIRWHQKAMYHAVQGGLMMMLVPVVWHEFTLTSLTQTVVTIMVAMSVPVTSLSLPRHPSSRKMVHRVMGCLLGSTLASVGIMLGRFSPCLIFVVLIFGIFMGKNIENSSSLNVNYVGTQLTLGLLVSLAPDHYHMIAIVPSFNRLTGMFAGMIILEPTRIVSRMLAHQFRELVDRCRQSLFTGN